MEPRLPEPDELLLPPPPELQALTVTSAAATSAVVAIDFVRMLLLVLERPPRPGRAPRGEISRRSGARSSARTGAAPRGGCAGTRCARPPAACAGRSG